MSFVAEERFPIGDEILQVANLRPINGRVVDFVENAFGDRKPDPTQSRVSGPHAVLVAACPAGFDPRTAASRMILQQTRHCNSFPNQGRQTSNCGK